MSPFFRRAMVWGLFCALLMPVRTGLAQSEHEGHGVAVPAREAPAAPEQAGHGTAASAQDPHAGHEMEPGMQMEPAPGPTPAKSGRKAKQAQAKNAAPTGEHAGHTPPPAEAPAATGHEGHTTVPAPAPATAPATVPAPGAAPAKASSTGHEGHGAPAKGQAIPGQVHITPEQQQLIGVKTGLVQEMSLDKTIRAVGVVDYDEKRLYTIAPKVGGWIENLYVDFTGRYVKKGEPLLSIYSPELVSTQAEYLTALQSAREMAKSPYPEVAASGNSLVAAARQRLKYWDISDRQIQAIEKSGTPLRTLTLYSPYSGFVLERLAFKGMNITPGMTLFKLADLSVVWTGSCPG